MSFLWETKEMGRERSRNRGSKTRITVKEGFYRVISISVSLRLKGAGETFMNISYRCRISNGAISYSPRISHDKG